MHVVFYGIVIGGNNEATNHSILTAIKAAYFYNYHINMPILGCSSHVALANVRDMQ